MESRNSNAILYAIQLDNGAFDKGRMSITVVDRGDRFGLVGINIIGGSAT